MHKLQAYTRVVTTMVMRQFKVDATVESRYYSNIMEVLTMQAANVKEKAYHLLENLPKNVTWDDLMYEIYVQQSIEAGVEDSKAGRTTDVKEVRAKFGLLI